MFYANHAVLFTIMRYHSIQPIKSRSPLCQDTPPVSIPPLFPAFRHSLPAGIIGGFTVFHAPRYIFRRGSFLRMRSPVGYNFRKLCLAGFRKV